MRTTEVVGRPAPAKSVTGVSNGQGAFSALVIMASTK